MEWIKIEPGCLKPEDKERVFLTIATEDNELEPTVIAARYITGYSSVDLIYSDIGEFIPYEAWASRYIRECVGDVIALAWMPYPEPYKNQ